MMVGIGIEIKKMKTVEGIMPLYQKAIKFLELRQRETSQQMKNFLMLLIFWFIISVVLKKLNYPIGMNKNKNIKTNLKKRAQMHTELF
jgi:hypothetical protein